MTKNNQDKINIAVITSQLSDIKDVSIDVYLDSVIKVEDTAFLNSDGLAQVKNITPGFDALNTIEIDIRNSYFMTPGQFVLGRLKQKIKLPKNVSALLYIKSSNARIGLDHSTALPMWPGWEGLLTLELTNNLENHTIELYDGMPLGTIIFFKHKYLLFITTLDSLRTLK